MRARKEMQELVASLLRDARTEAGITKAKMATQLGVDERTYARYESGESSPTIAEFLTMVGDTNIQVLPLVLRYLYPETYGACMDGAETDHIRRAVAEYVMQQASALGVREMAYILFGKHGSANEAQLQLFCALDHLPMDVRLAIAKLVLNSWEIESARGGIINPECAMPDVELLRQAIIRAQKAVMEGRSSYSTAIK